VPSFGSVMRENTLSIIVVGADAGTSETLKLRCDGDKLVIIENKNIKIIAPKIMNIKYFLLTLEVYAARH
jgi:hypothetical protein